MTDPDTDFDAELQLRDGSVYWRIVKQPEWSRNSNRGELSLSCVFDGVRIYSSAFPAIYCDVGGPPGELYVTLRGIESEKDTDLWRCPCTPCDFRKLQVVLRMLRNPNFWARARIRAAVERCSRTR
jgi:hypothetical protein